MNTNGFYNRIEQVVDNLFFEMIQLNNLFKDLSKYVGYTVFPRCERITWTSYLSNSEKGSVLWYCRMSGSFRDKRFIKRICPFVKIDKTTLANVRYYCLCTKNDT